jgi:quercetin 2,3-dioxygenase
VLSGGTNNNAITQRQLGGLGSGSDIKLSTKSQSARLLLLAGIPIGEPIVKHGPFVMNTPDQIQQAINDYLAGKFV